MNIFSGTKLISMPFDLKSSIRIEIQRKIEAQNKLSNSFSIWLLFIGKIETCT